MPVKTLTIDGQQVSASGDDTILAAARSIGIQIPTLCHLDSLSCARRLPHLPGGNRGCGAASGGLRDNRIRRYAGTHRLRPRLREYRRTIVELLFAEGNHVCSVCVANGNCELQALAARVGMDHNDMDCQYPSAGDRHHSRALRAGP